jgi:hypothetical protein
MKILVVVESINVEDSSGSKVNVALIRNLAKAGFSLKVYHYSHQEILLNSIETHLIKENKRSIWYFLSRLQRTIQVLFKININTRIENFLGFSLAHTSDCLSIANAIKRDKNFVPDLVLTLSKGASFRPHRALLKLPNLHSKWMAYIHDPYPFHFYPKEYSWFDIAFKDKEKFIIDVFKSAKFIAYPSQYLMEWMEDLSEVSKGKGVVIPHQIGEQLVQNSPLSFFDKDQFSILHAGNLLKQRNPKYLILGFLNFLENNSHLKRNTKLYLIGPCEFHKNLLNSYENHPNIIIQSGMDYSSVQYLENNVSVNIILEAISKSSPFLPGKFPNLIIANKPILVLGPSKSETRRLLGFNYPYYAAADDVIKIENLISDLYSKWSTNKKDFNLNRTDLVEYCSENYLKSVITTKIL